jgi:hypothetical protein
VPSLKRPPVCCLCPPDAARPVFLHEGSLYCLAHLPTENLPLWQRVQINKRRCDERRQALQQRRVRQRQQAAEQLDV